jgi:hypothetical protein
MRKIKFKVVFQKDVGFCGEARIEPMNYFDNYEDAEKFIFEYPFPKIEELWIQKVYVCDVEPSNIEATV